MSSSLAKALAKFNKAAPESIDPEAADDFGDVLSARKKSKERLHPETDVQASVKKPEGRRLRQSELLSEPKYSGRKVSRAQLLTTSDDEDDDEDFEDLEGDENNIIGQHDLNSDEDDASEDGMEMVDALISDDAEGDEVDKSEDASDSSVSDVDESESESEEDEKAKKASMLLRKPRASRQDPQHVKNQYSLWCELVGLRIRLQGLVQSSFRFPSPDISLTEVAETGVNTEKVQEAKELMSSCANKLGDIVDKLIQIRETTDKAQSHFLPSLIESATLSSNVLESSRKRKRSPSWSAIEVGNQQAQTFVEETFDIWHRRMTESKGGRKALKAVNRSISEQVNEVMQGGDAFLARSQIRPPGVSPIGGVSDHAKSSAVNPKPVNNSGEGEVDPEVYNDSSFYQQLLLAFVSSSNATSAARVAEVDDEDVQERLRRKLDRENKKKKKRDVDTQASKGRKLRYTVHEKLVNFVAPRPVEEPSVDTVQLFASLFQD